MPQSSALFDSAQNHDRPIQDINEALAQIFFLTLKFLPLCFNYVIHSINLLYVKNTYLINR